MCKKLKIRCEVAGGCPPCLRCRTQRIECVFGVEIQPTEEIPDEESVILIPFTQLFIFLFTRRFCRLESQVAGLSGVIQMLSEQLLHHIQWCNKSSVPLSSSQSPIPSHLEYPSPLTNPMTSTDELELLPPSIGIHLPSDKLRSIGNGSRSKANEGGSNFAAMCHPLSQASGSSCPSRPPINQVCSPPPEPIVPSKWSSGPIMEGAFASEGR